MYAHLAPILVACTALKLSDGYLRSGKLRRGHHVVVSIWSPTIGEQLVCKRQISNPQDVYTVAVMRGAV